MRLVRRLLGIGEHLSFVDVVLALLRVGVVVFAVVGITATIQRGSFTLADWGSFVLAGLALGAVYALLALGYTLVYGILFMINFAHGDVFMTGAFTAYFAANAMAQSGFLAQNEVLSFIIVLLVSSGVAALVAVVLERVAYRPLRNAPRLVPLITAIGASLFLENTFRGLYGAGVKAYPTWKMFQGSIKVAGLDVSYSRIVVVVGAIAMMVGLWWFVEHTRTGRAMRAVSENKDVAAMMGIDVDRVILTTFAIGGLLAGAAGILYTLLFNQVHFFMGFFPGIKAFTAAVLGGIGNIVGAMLGGLMLGILEAVGPYLLLDGFHIPSVNQLKDVVAFLVLVLVLIFRPSGILGRKENT
jgi:branched-chain amino acid transport system permease protein